MRPKRAVIQVCGTFLLGAVSSTGVAPAARAAAPPTLVLYPRALKSDEDIHALVDLRKKLRADGQFQVITYDPASATLVRAAADAHHPEILTGPMATDGDRLTLTRALGAAFFVVVSKADGRGKADVHLVESLPSARSWDVRGRKTEDAAAAIEQQATAVLQHPAPAPSSAPAAPILPLAPVPAPPVTAPAAPPVTAPAAPPVTAPAAPPVTAPAAPPVTAPAAPPVTAPAAPPVTAPAAPPVTAPAAPPVTAPAAPPVTAPAAPPVTAPAAPPVTAPAAPPVTAPAAPPVTAPAAPPVTAPAAPPVTAPAAPPVTAPAAPPVTAPAAPPAPSKPTTIVVPSPLPIPAPSTVTIPPTAAPPVAAPPMDDLSGVMDKLRDGDAQLSAGNFVGAIALYRDAVNGAPLSAAPRLKLAQAYLEADMRDKALDEAQRALQIAPGSAALQQFLMQIDAQSGKADGAVARFKAQVLQDPQDAMSHVELGDALWNNNALDQAEQEYKSGQTLAGAGTQAAQTAAAHLARLYAAQKRYDASLTALGQAGPGGYALALGIVQSRTDTLSSTLEAAQDAFKAGTSTHADFYKAAEDVSAQAQQLADFVIKVTPPPAFKISHLYRIQATHLLAQQAAVLVTYIETSDPAKEDKAAQLGKDAQTGMLMAHAAEQHLGLWGGRQAEAHN